MIEIQKVTDPTKIATDFVLLERLVEQCIDLVKMCTDPLMTKARRF